MEFYTKVTNDIIRSGKNLNGNQFRVLALLMSYENCENGCSYPSQSRLMKESGLSKSTLLRSLEELENKGYITREKELGKNNKYYIKTSVKNDTTENETSVKNDTTTSTKNDTSLVSNLVHKNKQENKQQNKKEKETNFDKMICAYTKNNELVEAIKDFIKMRKTIKKPLTDRALSGILKKLDLLGTSEEEKVLVLEASIENCWQGVFELKNKKATTGIVGSKNNSYNPSICINARKNDLIIDFDN